MQVVEEINLLKKFSNPHIIRFIEAFESPGEVIIIIFTKEEWIKSGNPDKPSVLLFFVQNHFFEGDPDHGIPGWRRTL